MRRQRSPPYRLGDPDLMHLALAGWQHWRDLSETVSTAIRYLTNQNIGIVSEPRAVATGSGGTLEILRYFLIRSLSLAVLTQKVTSLPPKLLALTSSAS